MIVAAGGLIGATVGAAPPESLHRASCLRDERVREVELRMVTGVEGVCDVIERNARDGTEERALHAENGDGFCRARFDDRVRALENAGWRCAEVGASRPSEPAVPARPPDRAPSPDAPFAARYRERCEAALEPRYPKANEICDCAVRLMNETGFTERDYEVLAAPYGDSESDLPVHAAGLLYGLGTIAVDALERCGTRP